MLSGQITLTSHLVEPEMIGMKGVVVNEGDEPRDMEVPAFVVYLMDAEGQNRAQIIMPMTEAGMLYVLAAAAKILPADAQKALALSIIGEVQAAKGPPGIVLAREGDVAKTAAAMDALRDG